MSRISRLVYGSPDSKAGAAESLFNIVNNPALNHAIDVRTGVLSEECTKLMQDFFRKDGMRRGKSNRFKLKAITSAGIL